MTQIQDHLTQQKEAAVEQRKMLFDSNNQIQEMIEKLHLNNKCILDSDNASIKSMVKKITSKSIC
jgi:ribosomal protein L30/L7E